MSYEKQPVDASCIRKPYLLTWLISVLLKPQLEKSIIRQEGQRVFFFSLANGTWSWKRADSEGIEGDLTTVAVSPSTVQ